jgi:hypothetical protein
MVVHAHADRRAVGAARGEERVGVAARSVDQLAGVREVDRLDAQRARRREDDQLRVARMALDVVDEPPLGEEADRVQGDRERSARGRLERACMAGGKHVDLLRAELDRM